MCKWAISPPLDFPAYVDLDLLVCLPPPARHPFGCANLHTHMYIKVEWVDVGTRVKEEVVVTQEGKWIFFTNAFGSTDLLRRGNVTSWVIYYCIQYKCQTFSPNLGIMGPKRRLGILKRYNFASVTMCT
jgi:hypothetical protein